MTNTPGDGQPPHDPTSGQPGMNQPGQDQPGQNQPGQIQPGQDQAGYWEQQSAQGQQPYGAAGYPAQAPTRYAPDHPQSTTVLVLGILGLVLCGILAPFAWSMGRKAVAEIDASNGMIGGRGGANAGYILGIIGTVILGLSLLLVIVVFGIVGLGTMASSGY